ncbi:MAG: toxin-antitoxin system YwqK family antitoxin [Ignavibacteriales bacterium]
MKDASKNYKASYLFIFLTVLFIASAIIITPLLSRETKDDGSSHIVLNDGLIYMQGENSPYNGRVLDTLENKIIQYDVVNGLKHGEFIISTLNGKFNVCGFLEKNKNVGNWKYYYENGTLESTGSFKDDKANGKWTWYYQNGSVKSEGVFILGLREGKWINFDEQGFPISIIHYLRGETIDEIQISKPKMV